VSLVSILIPAHNAERWIAESMESAIQQTWQQVEIIVVDDGSTDRTHEVAQSFASPCVKVVSQPNSGASATRNRALSLAQGDYIQWLDADDVLARDKVDRQLAEVSGSSDELVLLSGPWGRFYYDTRMVREKPTALWQTMPPLDWMLTRFSDTIWIHTASWLVSRKLSDLAGPWDERLTLDDDGEYFCRVARHSDLVRFVPHARCFYRDGNSSSLSSLRSDKALDSLFLATQLCIEHLLALEESERTRRACLMLLQNRVHEFHPTRVDLLDETKILASRLGGEVAMPGDDRRIGFGHAIAGRRLARNLLTMARTAKGLVSKTLEKCLHSLSPSRRR